jgi:hypothetical protein
MFFVAQAVKKTKNLFMLLLQTNTQLALKNVIFDKRDSAFNKIRRCDHIRENRDQSHYRRNIFW